jgi:hypothetical protein
MTAHSLIREVRVRRETKNRLVKLGWSHFWLLACILAGMLSLVALVYFADLSSR